jgi:NADH-quinone oxidoreductase subunit L
MGGLNIWGIFLAPLLSFFIIALVIRPFAKPYQWISPYILISALGVSFILSVKLLADTVLGDGGNYISTYTWLVINESAVIDIGAFIDPLSSITLVVVVLVSLLVQIYSIGYMHGDKSYSRYFSFMALFTASMIGLVLSSNIVQLYAFWELVGLSSYLLIGFWNERPAAAAAAKKAFIITRIGDVGFLIAILLLVKFSFNSSPNINVFHIPDICTIGTPGVIISGTLMTLITLGIVSGAMGKSAQFPFHTWLPDAMEGPTPVSALVHSATMVAAGVFLLGRLYPFISNSQTTMLVIAAVGAFTAVFAATMGLVVNDIKRVLAYSSISQLGYMVAAIGLGGFAPAIFHLITHAFFKALLFLGSGSVNHATGTFDMRQMGGLRKVMPWTYTLMGIGCISLIGLPPLSGFWSKDEIILTAWEKMLHGSSFYLMILIALGAGIILTAFYTWRMFNMTFLGDNRAAFEDKNNDGHDTSQIHESPAVMVAPMVVLAIPAIFIGFFVNPMIDVIIPAHWLNEFLMSSVLFHGSGHHALEFNIFVAIGSTCLGISGIVIGIMYSKKTKNVSVEPLEKMGPVYELLSNKYYLDTLYEDVIVKNLLQKRLVSITAIFDKYIVDGISGVVGFTVKNIGYVAGLAQNGNIQFYTFVITLGGVAGLIILLVYTPGLGG